MKCINWYKKDTVVFQKNYTICNMQLHNRDLFWTL